MTAESDREYWERHARKYDRSVRLLGRPLRGMLELASKAVEGCDRVLEVAAGTGLVTAGLAQSARTVVATDYAQAMVEVLEQRVRKEGLLNVTCEVADLYVLRFERGAFDAVVAANVLHLVPDFDGAVAAICRVLKPGGILIAPTFCHDETMTSRVLSRVLAITGFPSQRRFTAKSLGQALEGAGLEVTRSQLLPGPIPIGYVEGRLRAGCL